MSAALGLALTELWLLNLQPLPAEVAGGWEQIGFWRLERAVIARQLPQGIFLLGRPGEKKKEGLIMGETAGQEFSCLLCVHSQLLCHRTKGCPETVIHYFTPLVKRHTGQLHPSSSLAPPLPRTSPWFWEGGRLLEQSGWGAVGTRIHAVGFQSLPCSVSPGVSNSMSDLPCPASGHGTHLCVYLSLPVKRTLSLPLDAL